MIKKKIYFVIFENKKNIRKFSSVNSNGTVARGEQQIENNRIVDASATRGPYNTATPQVILIAHSRAILIRRGSRASLEGETLRFPGATGVTRSDRFSAARIARTHLRRRLARPRRADEDAEDEEAEGIAPARSALSPLEAKQASFFRRHRESPRPRESRVSPIRHKHTRECPVPSVLGSVPLFAVPLRFPAREAAVPSARAFLARCSSPLRSNGPRIEGPKFHRCPRCETAASPRVNAVVTAYSPPSFATQISHYYTTPVRSHYYSRCA